MYYCLLSIVYYLDANFVKKNSLKSLRIIFWPQIGDPAKPTHKINQYIYLLTFVLCHLTALILPIFTRILMGLSGYQHYFPNEDTKLKESMQIS